MPLADVGSHDLAGIIICDATLYADHGMDPIWRSVTCDRALCKVRRPVRRQANDSLCHWRLQEVLFKRSFGRKLLSCLEQ